MKRFLLLLAVGGVCCAEEFAQPSDAVLRSAYCIPIAQWGIDYTTKKVAISADGQTPGQQSANAQAQKALEKWESALHRLRAYLIPRMPNRDPRALALALKPGEFDAQQLERTSIASSIALPKKMKVIRHRATHGTKSSSRAPIHASTR